MLSFNRKYGRRFVILAMTLFVGACGFKPLYTAADGSAAGANARVPFHEITIPNIPGRSGQYLRNRLIDTIYTEGRPVSPRYTLQVGGLREEITRLGIRKDASATRAQMRINATVTLIDRAGEPKPVLKRTLDATNSFNILSSQYTTQVTEQYARERALDELARQITRQLALYFNRGEDENDETDLSAD